MRNSNCIFWIKDRGIKNMVPVQFGILKMCPPAKKGC